LQVSDGREKVWRRGEVLVGEVAEVSFAVVRRRRVYTLPGAYLLVDAEGSEARITARGSSACIVLGNRFTRELAGRRIGEAGGRLDQRAVEDILAGTSRETASVSREHTVLTSKAILPEPGAALLRALEEECQEGGWRLCDRG
jgi:hypothetical protein